MLSSTAVPMGLPVHTPPLLPSASSTGQRTLTALEFPKVLAHLAERCLSEAAKEQALALRSLPTIAAVEASQILFEECRSWMAEGDKMGAFPDVRNVLTYLAGRDPLLDNEALWAMKEMLLIARRASESILEGAARRPSMVALLTGEASLSVAALCRCVGEEGQLKDESSPGLLLARSELRSLHQGCMRRVKDYANTYNIAHYLQDDFMTLSSDRYVLPLKANFKGRMQGIIHDYSSTGETVYFEPMFLIEQNNRLQELRQEEREEERKVLRTLSQVLVQELPQVEAAWNLLVELDFTLAKCKLGNAFAGRMVEVRKVEVRKVEVRKTEENISVADKNHKVKLEDTEHATAGCDAKAHTLDDGENLSRAYSASEASGDLYLPEARHPLLALASNPVEPILLALRPGDRVLVISGGNAGGKTVALKTLGLIALMTLSGLPTPTGVGSRLPGFARIHAFIGDEQSLEEQASTFTGQIKHLSAVWSELGPHSLILLDEFGAGTDPSQGAALAQAVLDGLLEKEAFALTATHFPALKTYALTHDHVRAASVLFDPKTRRPLFHLAYDQVGASQALSVAKEHGLPDYILRKAEQYLLLDGEDSTAVMDRLNELARVREQELRDLRQEEARTRDKRKQLQERFEKDRLHLYDEVRQKSQELMHAWKAGKATAKQALKEMSLLRASLHESPASSPAKNGPATPPTVGQEVRHRPWNKRATVVEVDSRNAKVRLDMNGVSLWASLDDIENLNKPAPVPTGHVRTQLSRPTSYLRLDLRGKRADIALEELSQFLDRALLDGPEGVEIVHGRGTGALRKAVHQLLKSFPGIASYACAPEDQGGDGMTLVTFR